MTTLHLTRFYSPHIGGVEKHVAELLSALSPKNFPTKIVITLQHDAKLPLQENINGVMVYRLPLISDTDKLALWRSLWQLRRLFWQADVIHVHDVFWWLAPFYLFVSTKVYLTFHGWEGQYPVPFLAKLQRLVYASLAQATTHVGAYIQEFYWDKPTIVVYGGINQVSKNKPRLKLGRSKVWRIVFVGRLVPENNIAGYCQVLSRLRKHKIQYDMTWIGDGVLARKCQRFGRVTGLVVDPAKMIARADLVFANSYLAMLEAQSLGKLVISLADHQLKQRYLETYPAIQSVVYAHNVTTLTTEILSIVHNPKLMQIMAESAKSEIAHLTWTNLARQYEKLWLNQRLGNPS